ncbi:death on curing protein [Candidatus Hakubella thermalkaliphila]|uniref:Death on curing protein n=1 Tax=Candidatus Hakubella thermalkaliphila TaxID=2754717 RepID=A0A6V8P3G8_9ACTN|nr:type II toxin-antitoxin system death-on-curing family toxin [Candidatus Hakubella thermalkaliphila]GFP22117.1 death on curing protein [Candidatus Hakubella thermalkaliphila]GFP27122.1 death on curing protein [Candidatus Hakubella thermalkaliphila]
MKAPRYIPKAVVLMFQEDLIRRYGGSPGLRDEGLLDSALAQPQARFGNKELHSSLFAKAAAYCYHLCLNHPFVDGNKRLALVVTDTFLQMNGYELTASEEEAFRAISDVAAGRMTKEELAQWVERHSKRLRPSEPGILEK